MKPAILKMAVNDLRDIHGYLSQFGQVPPRKLRESFEKFCDAVLSMPYMYGKYEYNADYRKAVIEYGYLVFYKVEEGNNRVYIHRVLNGKREVTSLLE